MRSVLGYECLRCGSTFGPDLVIDSRGCPMCSSSEVPSNVAVLALDRSQAPSPDGAARTPSLWRFASALPCGDEDAVSMGEGLTPLLHAKRLGGEIGLINLMIKDESKNPTGSHKDRFSTVAVSMARLQSAEVVATASSGNAGASLAAYAARAGLRCIVATFQGTSGAMLQQIRKYGATVVEMANKADRWALLAGGRARFGWAVMSPFRAPVVGSHPVGIEGYKTLAFEIVEQMHGEVPDWCALPVCYGDALVGMWRGFEELRRSGRIQRSPRLLAAEVHGSLARALASKSDILEDTSRRFDTLAVSIGTTRSTFQALMALRSSDGAAVAIGNDGLVDLQERLASREGVLAELASVTSLGAITRLQRKGLIRASDRVVAIMTGSGLKDLELSCPPTSRETVFQSAAEAWEHLDSRLRPPAIEVPGA